MNHHPGRRLGGSRCRWRAVMIAGLSVLIVVLVVGLVSLMIWFTPVPAPVPGPTVAASSARPTILAPVASPIAAGATASDRPLIPSPTASPTAAGATVAMVMTPPPTIEESVPPLLKGDETETFPFYGVFMEHMIPEHGLLQALDAGVEAVRYGAISWKDVEPVRTDPPTYHWEVIEGLDADLISAAHADLQVALLVLFTPDWAQEFPGHSCGPIREDKLNAFAQFLQAAVERYSSPPYNVKYWELFNEPDVDPAHVPPDSVFGCWGNQDDEYYGARLYAEMLKQAYPAIKQADPQARVLMGGLLLDCDPQSPPPDKDCSSATFLEGILINGGGPFFDIAGYHAYTYYRGELGPMANPNWPGSVTTIPEKAAFLRDVLGRHGYEGKPLLNSEAALLCFRPTDECLEAQAMYVPRAYAEALALGLEGQVYYAMINEEWRHTGLLLPDLTPKPVYHAYDTATHFLTAVTYEGPAMGYAPGIAGYAFRRNDAPEYIDVIWSVNGTVQNMVLPSEASAHDRYGDLVAASGVVQVDYSPLYVLRR